MAGCTYMHSVIRDYLERVKGPGASGKFFRNTALLWGTSIIALFFFILIAGPMGGPADSGYSAMNAWIFFGSWFFTVPAARMAIFMVREMKYRRATRGSLPSRLRETGRDYFPRIFP